jgi:hypothetical protein
LAQPTFPFQWETSIPLSLPCVLGARETLRPPWLPAEAQSPDGPAQAWLGMPATRTMASTARHEERTLPTGFGIFQG